MGKKVKFSFYQHERGNRIIDIEVNVVSDFLRIENDGLRLHNTGKHQDGIDYTRDSTAKIKGVDEYVP